VLDRPGRDLELLGGEFLARYCPHAARIELRSGPVASQVAEVADEEHADLVVLSWSQDSSPNRVQVVRELLGRSPIPVLLLPVGPGAAPRLQHAGAALRPGGADELLEQVWDLRPHALECLAGGLRSGPRQLAATSPIHGRLEEHPGSNGEVRCVQPTRATTDRPAAGR
jgi:hypothetical protein